MPARIKRREFIRAGAGAAAATFVPARLFAGDPPCNLQQLTQTDIEALANALSGASNVVLPTSPSYETLRTTWNGVYNPYPTTIVEAGSTQDVAATVNWCSARDVHPRIRNGGHSFAGYSMGDTLVIDLRKLNHVSIDSDEIATIGAGTNLGRTYCELHGQGERSLPAGSCPPVGISGLAMAGGLGSLMRQYGLTLDMMRSAEVVLADGSIVTASEDSESDLFWALRGGGSGSYGVVTQWTFQSVPYFPRSVKSVSWPWEDFVPVFEAWQTWSQTLPREVYCAMAVFANPTTNFEMVMEANTSIIGTLDAYVDDLVALCGIPTNRRPDPAPIHLPTCPVTEGVSYGTHKSRIVNNTIVNAGAEIIKEAMEAHENEPALSGSTAFILFDLLGGAISDVAHDATAWVHRDGLYSGQFGVTWDELGPNPALLRASKAWLAEFYDKLDPYVVGGCYQGYWDPDVVNWPKMYYGSAYPRLRTVKSAYDPGNFFRFQRSIPPA